FWPFRRRKVEKFRKNTNRPQPTSPSPRQGRSKRLFLRRKVATALMLGRLIASQLYGISANDPLTISTVAGLLLLVALGACWVPARRAARVDPVRALRFE